MAFAPALISSVVFVAAWNAEFLLGEAALTEGVQNRFNLSAQVGPHAQGLLIQGEVQAMRERPAQQQIQLHFRQHPGQCFRWLLRQGNFATPRFLSVLTR